MLDLGKVCSNEQVSKTVRQLDFSFKRHVTQVERNYLLLIYSVLNQKLYYSRTLISHNICQHK